MIRYLTSLLWVWMCVFPSGDCQSGDDSLSYYGNELREGETFPTGHGSCILFPQPLATAGSLYAVSGVFDSLSSVYVGVWRPVDSSTGNTKSFRLLKQWRISSTETDTCVYSEMISPCFAVAAGDYVGVYSDVVPWGAAFYTPTTNYTTYVYNGYTDLVNGQKPQEGSERRFERITLSKRISMAVSIRETGTCDGADEVTCLSNQLPQCLLPKKVLSFGELPARTDRKFPFGGTAFIIGTITDTPGRLFAMEAFIRYAHSSFWVQVWRRTYEKLDEFQLISQYRYSATTASEYQAIVMDLSSYCPLVRDGDNIGVFSRAEPAIDVAYISHEYWASNYIASGTSLDPGDKINFGPMTINSPVTFRVKFYINRDVESYPAGVEPPTDCALGETISSTSRLDLPTPTCSYVQQPMTTAASDTTTTISTTTTTTSTTTTTTTTTTSTPTATPTPDTKTSTTTSFDKTLTTPTLSPTPSPSPSPSPPPSPSPSSSSNNTTLQPEPVSPEITYGAPTAPTVTIPPTTPADVTSQVLIIAIPVIGCSLIFIIVGVIIGVRCLGPHLIGRDKKLTTDESRKENRYIAEPGAEPPKELDDYRTIDELKLASPESLYNTIPDGNSNSEASSYARLGATRGVEHDYRRVGEELKASMAPAPPPLRQEAGRAHCGDYLTIMACSVAAAEGASARPGARHADGRDRPTPDGDDDDDDDYSSDASSYLEPVTPTQEDDRVTSAAAGYFKVVSPSSDAGMIRASKESIDDDYLNPTSEDYMKPSVSDDARNEDPDDYDDTVINYLKAK